MLSIFVALGGDEQGRKTCAGNLIGSVQEEVRSDIHRRSTPLTFWFLCLAFVNEVTDKIAIRGALKNDRTFVRSDGIQRAHNQTMSCNVNRHESLQNA